MWEEMSAHQVRLHLELGDKEVAKLADGDDGGGESSERGQDDCVCVRAVVSAWRNVLHAYRYRSPLLAAHDSGSWY